MELPKYLFQTNTLRNFTLATLSIWLLTGVTYSMLSWMIAGLRTPVAYMFYCGLASFILSMFIVFVLPENAEEGKQHLSWVTVMVSGMILYFSVNGMQAVYSSIQYSEPAPSDQTAEMLPFLSARPWFPPAGMYERTERYERVIRETRTENRQQLALIDSLRKVVAGCDIMTDSIFLTVVPNSKEVPNGGIYRSEIVLAAKLDKAYVKRIAVNDKELAIEDGVAIFEEVAEVGSGNVNVRNLNYMAEIELFNESKVITTFDSYRTIKPYLEVSSQAVNALYLNCGNQLTIKVPALGSDYNPKFEVIGGDFRYGRDPGALTIVPNSKKVTVSVYNQGIRIGSRSLPVRRIPSPSVKVFTSGGEIDLRYGMLAQVPNLELRVAPDPDFSTFLPQDAQYLVAECDVSLVSGRVVKGKMAGKNRVNITNLTRNARPGDVIRIEVKKVLRKNFKGDVENVLHFNPKFFAIPLK